MSLIQRVAVAGCAIVAASTLAPADARAATIAPIDSPYCNLTLQGEIKEGDLAAFKAAVESAAKMLAERLAYRVSTEEYQMKMRRPAAAGTLEAWVKQKFGPPMEIAETSYERFQRTEFAFPSLQLEMEIVHVCLNSGGGSFAEAHRIVQYMTSGPGVATIVRGGDECFSACALVFMFGNIQTFGSNRFIDRRLHVRGKLGFHAPYVNADTIVSEEVAKLAYQKGIEAVASLLEADNKGFLSRPLVVEFLRKGPNDYLDLDTVSKAGEWAVELMGYKVPDDITADKLSQACTNDIAWTARRRISSTSSNLPTHYNLTGNFLNGKAPPGVFPSTRFAQLDATRLLYTREATNEENEETDTVCCIIKAQRYQTPSRNLAMSIEQEKVFTDASLCQNKPVIVPITVPNKRTLVGSEGFTETVPAWFLYPPATPLTSIAAD